MPILSILIPSITQRFTTHLLSLIIELERQINLLENPNDVELIVFMDNKRRSIGHKRQGSLDLAKGLFIAYVDDDDKVDPLYVEKAVASIKANAYVDVLTFNQWVILNDEPPISLTFQLGHEKYDEISDAFPIRPPFHVCFWRRDLVNPCSPSAPNAAWSCTASTAWTRFQRRARLWWRKSRTARCKWPT
jgi:glycosyltransferase involved in cell wall biosynthesis